MQRFVILTSEGNLVESFDEESEARALLGEIAERCPETASEYAMLTYGNDGFPVGEAVSAVIGCEPVAS